MNEYLESVLTGIQRGVIVLDSEAVVRVWNAWSEDLWGMRRDEAEGRHFANLDIGLPVEQLMPSIRQALDGGAVDGRLVVTARNRRGFDFQCAVTCSPLRDDLAHGVILVMDEVPAS